MLSALVGFFSILPQLVTLLSQIFTYIQKASGNDPAGYVSRLGGAFAQLNQAQTDDEHAAAAKAIAMALASLPSK